MSEWILVDLDNLGIGYSNSGVAVFRLVDLAPQKDEMETQYLHGTCTCTTNTCMLMLLTFEKIMEDSTV